MGFFDNFKGQQYKAELEQLQNEYENLQSEHKKLQREYEKLPQSFMGYDNRNKIATDRTGVFEIESFYNKYTNCGSRPKDNVDWMKIPERFLSMVTNGEVFTDLKREFSFARENLLNFYPLDVLKKKLSARLATMAQSGQYNYPRCMKRHDSYAAYLACNEFVKNALSTIFLLNKKYMPFYKWSFKSAESLTKLAETVKKLKRLILLKKRFLMRTLQKLRIMKNKKLLRQKK